MIGKSINNRFKNKLFIKPSPIDGKSFASAHNILFPNSKAFLDFLSISEEQSKREKASKIILTFLYERNLPPPSWLLFNLLNIETNKKGSGKIEPTEYIGQDHFVHIVNLYLFGIYIYSYHPIINRYINDYIKHIQKQFISTSECEDSDKLNYRVFSENKYSLFAKLWSYFCLYHDLGYPLEMIHPEDREEDTNISFFKPFESLTKTWCKDISIKGLSKLLIIEKIIDNPEDLNLLNHISHVNKFYFFASTNSEDIPNDLKACNKFDVLPQSYTNSLKIEIESFRHIPNIKGPESLKIVQSVYKDGDIYIILENSISGEPLLLLLKNNNSYLCFLLTLPQNIPVKIRNCKIEELIKLAFEGNQSPKIDYEWNYFIRNSSQTFNSLISQLIPTVSLYKIAKEKVLEQINFENFLISEDIEISTLGTEIYSILQSSLGYLYDSDQDDPMSDSIEVSIKEFHKYTKTFYKVIGSNTEKLLKEYMKRHELDPYILFRTKDQEGLKSTLSEALNEVIPDISSVFERVITPEMKEATSFMESIKAIQKNFRNHIFSELNPTHLNANPFRLKSINKSFKYSDLNLNEFENQFTVIDEMLEKNKLPKIKDILHEYYPPFSFQIVQKDDASTVLDHGLGSAIILLTIQKLAKQIATKIKENKEFDVNPGIVLLRLALNLKSEIEDHFLILEVNQLLTNAIQTILIHNIYPENLPDGYKSFKTNLVKSPFSYLSLLADSLQVWDREQILNMALIKGKKDFDENEFDVEIHEKYLKITLKSNTNNQENFGSKYKEDISKFLENADKLIKIEFQYKKSTN